MPAIVVDIRTIYPPFLALAAIETQHNSMNLPSDETAPAQWGALRLHRIDEHHAVLHRPNDTEPNPAPLEAIQATVGIASGVTREGSLNHTATHGLDFDVELLVRGQDTTLTIVDDALAFAIHRDTNVGRRTTLKRHTKTLAKRVGRGHDIFLLGLIPLQTIVAIDAEGARQGFAELILADDTHRPKGNLLPVGDLAIHANPGMMPRHCTIDSSNKNNRATIQSQQELSLQAVLRWIAQHTTNLKGAPTQEDAEGVEWGVGSLLGWTT